MFAPTIRRRTATAAAFAVLALLPAQLVSASPADDTTIDVGADTSAGDDQTPTTMPDADAPESALTLADAAQPCDTPATTADQPADGTGDAEPTGDTAGDDSADDDATGDAEAGEQPGLCAPQMTSADVLASLLPPLTGSPTPAGADELRARYGSLSSALGQMYLAGGAPADAIAGLSDVPSLAAAGSLEDFTAQLAARSNDVSTTVVAAGAEWAAQLESLRTPALTAPDVSMPSLEQVAFGTFANQTVTAMVTDFPDLFTQVRRDGIGSPEALDAWRTSMDRAMTASFGDMTASLPSRCHAAMLTAMGSGDPAAANRTAGRDCGTCVATGLYLNGQMSRLFDPSRTSLSFDPSDSILPPAEFNQLQPWQRDAIIAQNPSLASQLPAATGSAPTGCGGGTAASSTAKVVLPSVFSALG